MEFVDDAIYANGLYSLRRTREELKTECFNCLVWSEEIRPFRAHHIVHKFHAFRMVIVAKWYTCKPGKLEIRGPSPLCAEVFS